MPYSVAGCCEIGKHSSGLLSRKSILDVLCQQGDLVYGMGLGMTFSGEGPKVYFPEVAKQTFAGWAKSAKISFYPLEIKKTTFIC